MTSTPTSFLELIDMISLIRQLPLFKDLNEDQLKIVAQAAKLKAIKKNKFIFKAEDESQDVFILVDGTLKLGNISDDGREMISSILHPRAFFGEEALHSSKRKTFAKAIDSSVRFLEIDKAIFTEVMRMNFDFNLTVVSQMGIRINKIEDRLESLVFNDARTRIINFIKDNANKFGRKVGLEMLLKHSLTQQDIANFTGTSRQTVTSVLNDLKKSNQIYFKRKSILIRDIESLV